MQAMTALAVLLSVSLSPPFVSAEARATSAGPDGMRLEVDVEVQGQPEAVVVRGVGLAGDELAPVALDDRGDGHWVGIVEVAIVADIRLAFEYLPKSGVGSQTDLYRLTELGVDPAVFQAGDGSAAPTTSAASGTESRRRNPAWAWLAFAAGAAGLALVLVWAMWPGKRGSGDRSEESGDESADADQEGVVTVGEGGDTEDEA